MQLPGPTFGALPATVVCTGSAAPYNLNGSPLMAFRDVASEWNSFLFMNGAVQGAVPPVMDGSLTPVLPTDEPFGDPPNLIATYITTNHQLAAIVNGGTTKVLAVATPRVRGTPAVLTLVPLKSWRIYAVGVDSKPYRVDFSATAGFGTWAPVAAGGLYESDLTVASDGKNVVLFGRGYDGILYELHDSGTPSHAKVVLNGQPVHADGLGAAAVFTGTPGEFHVLYIDPAPASQLRSIKFQAGAWHPSLLPANAPPHCRSVTATFVDNTQTWVTVVDSAATVWSTIGAI